MDVELTTLTATPWRNARASLSSALSLLDGLARRHRSEIAGLIADARPDTPAALWLAEEISILGSEPAQLREVVADESWAARIAFGLVDAHRIGAVSLGGSTRQVLETAAHLAVDPPVVSASSTVVARGLEDLGLEVIIADATAADATLIPTAAIGLGVIWTSGDGATALEQAPNPVVIADPVTVLGGWASHHYRPPTWVRRVDVTR